MLRIAISALALGILIVPSSWGQEQADPVERGAQLLKLSQQVYEQLASQSRQGELSAADVELLATWSRRIAGLRFANTDFWRLQGASQGIPPGVGQASRTLTDSLDGHIARMEALERLARAQVAAGKTRQATALAARFHRLEAESVKRKIFELPERVKGELRIELPKADQAAPLTNSKPDLEIDVDSKSRIKVGGRQVTIEQLGRHLKSAKRPLRSVLIRADPELRHADLVRIIDRIQELEGATISISIMVK